MSRPEVPAVLRKVNGGVVPTGYALLALVKSWGDKMLAEPDHAKYLEAREVYIELLVYAERDAICAPILIPAAQQALDEDARRHAKRLDKGR